MATPNCIDGELDTLLELATAIAHAEHADTTKTPNVTVAIQATTLERRVLVRVENLGTLAERSDAGLGQALAAAKADLVVLVRAKADARERACHALRETLDRIASAE